MPASAASRKRSRPASAGSARAAATDRPVSSLVSGKRLDGDRLTGKSGQPARRPLSAQINGAKRQRTKARAKATAAEVNAIAGHPSLGFGTLRVNAHS